VTFLETSATAAAVSRTHKHATRANERLQCGTLHRRPYSTTLAVKRRAALKTLLTCVHCPPKRRRRRKSKRFSMSLVRKYLPSRNNDVRGAGARTFNSFCRIAQSLSAAPIKARHSLLNALGLMWFSASKFHWKFGSPIFNIYFWRRDVADWNFKMTILNGCRMKKCKKNHHPDSNKVS
jgi:hypothetical protein